MKTVLVLAVVLLSAACVANDAGPDAISSLKVDVAKVVEIGRVQPVDGITSAGQPDQAALAVFKENGYVAVIDLRGPQEDRGLDEQEAVEALGMDYVSLPVTGADAINFDNARELDRLVDTYDGPVLVHCGSGNRVGALLALRASLEGADTETAIQEGRKGGLTRLEELVRTRLEKE